MATLRTALAQIDTTVGDLDGNADLVVAYAKRAAAAGADLVAFPEMTLTGYPPEDLVLRDSFVAASRARVQALAGVLADEGCGELAVVVGFVDTDGEEPRPVGTRTADGARDQPRRRPRNAFAVLWRGGVAIRGAKHHLPNYGVFDEARYFARSTTLPVVRLRGVDVGVVVCEDLWQDGGPVAVARAAGVGLVVCINGSPYERGKGCVREEIAARRAREAGAPIAYVNLVGGQDELVFDGGSFVVDADGRLLARAPQFMEALLTVDVGTVAATADTRGTAGATGGTVPSDADLRVERVTLSTDPRDGEAAPPPPVTPFLPDEQEVWTALVTGLRDYATKNRFPSVVLGLSGGIDSALVATLAVDALGADRVHTVAMPSVYSTSHSLTDAEELARRQGTRHSVHAIAQVVAAYKALTELHGLAEENLQARVRGTLLMALSNEHGHLVLTTGNKSEAATGFSTLYGDSAGGFAPIKDIPKTLVWRLARWRNTLAADRGEVPPIPENSIEKPPSAELAPGQLDSDRLPDYEALDAVLDAYVEHDRGRAEMLADGHPAATVDRVLRLVDAAEYKRRQSPPGPKVTPKAFGRDRRLPITSRWREPAGESPRPGPRGVPDDGSTL